MNIDAMNTEKQKLEFTVRLIAKEISHLNHSKNKIFSTKFDMKRAESLSVDFELAESVEAFSARFARLQDTVGDKLLPLWLTEIGELEKTFIDNLNKAEKLEIISSPALWIRLRKLRNQMVHEYIEDLNILVDALNTANEHVEYIENVAQTIIEDLTKRKLIDDN